MSIDIQELLDMLTPEQLEELAKKKRENSQEKSKTGKKRKQSRKKKSDIVIDDSGPTPADEEENLNRREKRQRKKVITSLDQNIPNKGKKARNLGQPKLGPRPNRMVDGDWKVLQNAFQQDTKADKLLIKDRVSMREILPKREQSFITATCHHCNAVYDDIPSSLCYKDDSGYAFVCDNCINGKR